MGSVANQSQFLANNQLRKRLENCANLPSPPGVAAQIIDLSQDLTADTARVAQVVSQDPALSAKVLRLANTPTYARHRKIDNLRQALMLFGLNGTLNLALSFSLVGTFRGKITEGLNYGLFWRRSLAAATCCRILGLRLQPNINDEFFLSALLQDIGILALDKLDSDLYHQIGNNQADHHYLVRIEKEKIGSDHTEVGAWLLRKWRLPESIICAVSGSHDPSSVQVVDEFKQRVQCTALSGAMADIWCRENSELAMREAANMAGELLGLNREIFSTILSTSQLELCETLALFDVDFGDRALIESIIDRAQEILMVRAVQAAHEVATLRDEVKALKSKADELRETARRDSLTGLYNRDHFETIIREEFEAAKRKNWPLALLFVDLDHFKQINDGYGHNTGDIVLQNAAQLIIETTRDTDVVARYGGDEFIIALIGTDAEGANGSCQRLLDAFRKTVIVTDDIETFDLAISIGLAIQDMASVNFNSFEQLIKAADKALYLAKKQGRNRFACFNELVDERHRKSSL